jgi:hypothetical protein
MDEIDGLDFDPEWFEDLTPAEVDRIGQELSGRLDEGLRYRDAVALEAALSKAVAAGARQALAAVNRSLSRQGISIDFSVPITADVDVWLERFGDEADDDE